MNVFTETPDRPNKRRAQKAATARKVLLAARDAFERDGFEGASVRGIARDAGVAVGTVLKHYGDKRQLLFAALHEALDEALEAASAEAARTLDDADANVVDRLLAVADSVFEVYRARPTLGRTLLREALFADGEWGVRFVQQTGRAHGLVATLVRDAVARGELPPTDPEELGLAFLSFFYFALISWAQGAPLPFGPLGLIERLLVGRLGLAPRRSKRTARTAKEG
ncbi:MAG: TetR/AcrR family transcriptional regulator [Sandaracinus sp.]|nr:TetR/AcrR family transcriptional regulator [Sandaracinus sp.]